MDRQEPQRLCRGLCKVWGQWMSLEDAQQANPQKSAWWTTPDVDGNVMEVKQYDPWGPPDKPIWVYDDGDQYLGEWRPGMMNCVPLEDGRGIMYQGSQPKWQGFLHIGQYELGRLVGRGKATWLRNAPSWVNNYLGLSPIRKLLKDPVQRSKYGGSTYRCLPFVYEGHFKKGMMCDSMAKVTLKDGTVRVGPWEEDEAIGDWFEDHKLLVAGASSSSAGATTATVSSSVASATAFATAPVFATVVKKEEEEEISYHDESVSNDNNDGNDNHNYFSTDIIRHRRKRKEPDRLTPLEVPTSWTQKRCRRTLPTNARKCSMNSTTPKTKAKTSTKTTKPKKVPSRLKSSAASGSRRCRSSSSSSSSSSCTSAVVTPTKTHKATVQAEAEAAVAEEAEASEKEQRINKIATFITEEVFAMMDPVPSTMKIYATKLFEEGFVSIEYLKMCLTNDDIQKMTFFNPIDKRIMLKRWMDTKWSTDSDSNSTIGPTKPPAQPSQPEHRHDITGQGTTSQASFVALPTTQPVANLPGVLTPPIDSPPSVLPVGPPPTRAPSQQVSTTTLAHPAYIPAAGINSTTTSSFCSVSAPVPATTVPPSHPGGQPASALASIATMPGVTSSTKPAPVSATQATGAASGSTNTIVPGTIPTQAAPTLPNSTTPIGHGTIHTQAAQGTTTPQIEPGAIPPHSIPPNILAAILREGPIFASQCLQAMVRAASYANQQASQVTTAPPTQPSATAPTLKPPALERGHGIANSKIDRDLVGIYDAWQTRNDVIGMPTSLVCTILGCTMDTARATLNLPSDACLQFALVGVCRTTCRYNHVHFALDPALVTKVKTALAKNNIPQKW